MRRVANDFDDAVIDGVHKIANHLCKTRGYQTRINREDVRIVLESASLLIERIEKQEESKERENAKMS